MAGPRKPNQGQLPRRAATGDTLPGIDHDHGDGDAHHKHRLGNIDHTHNEDGQAVFEGNDGRSYVDDGQPLPPVDVPGVDAFGSTAEGYFTPATPPERPLPPPRPDEVAAERRTIATNGQPRPNAVIGPPGSRLADVTARAVSLSMDGYPAEVQDEVIWTEIATHALVSMREEQAQTRRPADPALIAAALDAVDHIARARGLV
jgi:hypothetical protein